MVERGLKCFLEVAQALAEIRDLRLYRHTSSTFEEYLYLRWRIVRSHGYRLIAAAALVAELTDHFESSQIEFLRGSDFRSLLRAPTPEARVEVLQEAYKLAGDDEFKGKHLCMAMKALGYASPQRHVTKLSDKESGWIGSQGDGNV